MANINTLNSPSAYGETAAPIRSSAAAQPAAASTATSTAQATNSGGVQLSGMARLLSEAATRAAARDAGTDRRGLAAIADATIEKLLGPGYNQNKAAYDAEVPDSTDPQRLAQATQATDFLNGKGTNPFKGMSRDQLALITYDDSGAFTVNERRAAWQESYDQNQEWKRAVVARIMEEYNSKGQVSASTYQSILDHYQSLPAIEEAQLPKGYASQLMTMIQQGGSDDALTRQQEALRPLLNALMVRTEQAQVSAQ
ncbi:hypothetical protein [Dickeya dianthicola]|uniref:hypothetical protein n=2 Tax=Dickeya dianthicola TaxID=204039 RepID=UPI0003A355A6|nr:hypothetical protein [Dickeya dianthicola]ATO35620.1 hypothetical protein DDI_4452 [Dickeya dianthicola RNS04.9]MBT1426259.1 hypothetical protein [Dickeya dianthicola]MBT1430311.1 hypothetical protein [Dickeya dianthicola]MBT1457779.1 hypothetical protein [Dickeya dianthicola]MBT1486921.1 hypothetical protein [Dickeya dianthicola]